MFYLSAALRAGVLIAICTLTIGCQNSAERPVGGINVTDPWVRAVPPTSMMTAGYFTITNDTAATADLVGIKTTAFAEASLHESIQEDGMNRMRATDSILIGPGDSVALAPGGFHVMLHHPTNPLQAGDKVQFELLFRNGETIVIDAEVRPLTTP